jgi:rhodanese-related sulfurtransferase
MALIDQLPVTIVEALGAGFFADAHLPGAINIPPDQVDQLVWLLPSDHAAQIVVYCSGTCAQSEMTALRLCELGYRNVAVYRGGKEDWVEHGLPVERDTEG